MNKIKSNITNIVKIMALLMEDVEKNKSFDPSEGMVLSKLAKKGYSLEDINTAMKWLSLILTNTMALSEMSGTARSSGRSNAVRQLHESESLRLTYDAQNMLFGLMSDGRISPMQFEKTMEYMWRNDLRQVTPTRLELLLLMNDTEPHPPDAIAGDKIPPPLRLH